MKAKISIVTENVSKLIFSREGKGLSLFFEYHVCVGAFYEPLYQSIGHNEQDWVIILKSHVPQSQVSEIRSFINDNL